MTTTRFIVAAGQMTSGADLDANLATCRELAADAGGRGAALLVLPECFAFLGVRESDKFEVAEALDPESPGPILAALQEMAREHSMWVIGGGLPERIESERVSRIVTSAHNTSVAISPDGELAASYRKIHLFDVDIPGKATLVESKSTTGGDAAVAVDTDLGTIGMTICYDVRFPELYRELAVGMGAQLITVPAAFTAHTGRAHWHALLRARAIENQCYLVAAAQTGRHNEKRASFGHSAIYDPWGDLLAELADGTGVVTAEIDLERVDEVRRNMPCFEHSRLLPHKP